MIHSFKCKETEKLFDGYYSKKLPKNIQRIAQRKLKQLEFAFRLDDLRVPPGNNLESLKGKKKGQHSIRINDQWRICFIWKEEGAYKVEIVDYH